MIHQAEFERHSVFQRTLSDSLEKAGQKVPRLGARVRDENGSYVTCSMCIL